MGESKFLSLANSIGTTSGLVYVNIPKNASCWVKNHFDGIDFNYYNGFDPTQHRVIVILRDPLERWVSGFVQMISGDDSNSDMGIDNIVWDEIFDTIAYDNHTQKQIDFIANIPHDSIDWFCFEDNLVNNYVNYMLNYGITIIPKDESTFHNKNIFNRTSHDAYRRYLTSRVLEILNSEYQQKIQNFYKEDYQLINSVKFYEPR